MTSATATRGGNPPDPIRREGRHFTADQTGHWNTLDPGQPDIGAFLGTFLPGQGHLPSDSSADNPMLAGTLISVWESPWDNVEPPTRLENAAFESATDSFVWGPLTPWHTAWSVPPLIGESLYGLAFGIAPSGILARLDEFRALEDGWYDGYGSAPSSQGLDWLRQHAARNLGDSPTPYIYPTPEGGVQFEWDIGSFRPSLEIDLETRVGEWHCLDIDADEAHERELQLERPQDWQWLAEQLLLLQDGAK